MPVLPRKSSEEIPKKALSQLYWAMILKEQASKGTDLLT
jgi:hypothetical protein